jgi:hypothetical protein
MGERKIELFGVKEVKSLGEEKILIACSAAYRS